ncbi:MAG: pseudouridine synthase [Agriterribacter sp.]
MSRKAFDKFINKPESGAKKKEKIRQEKKKARAEKNAYFDEQKRLAWERRNGVNGNQQSAGGNRQSTISKQPSAGNRQRAAGSEQRSNANTKQPLIGNRQLEIKKTKSNFPNQKPQATRQAGNSSNLKSAPGANSKSEISNVQSQVSNDEMPLNKFIAWSGVCGRREAADLVKAGKVMVNGKVVTEPPHRVSQQDVIKVNGKKISIQKNLVYILLNKPKDYITTTDDPEGRKTVMDLIKSATAERVFPVGRLDRNTTGVLLLTNDGEVAQRLTHPKYEVKKIYEVRLDKAVTKQQLDTIAGGITLEDGFIQPDMVAYADAKDKSVIGIEIHSGRNRIVRRIFEHLGFDVKNLDRVMYGIFTKKNIERGKWRMLTEKEIRLLKHLNTSFKNKKPS